MSRASGAVVALSLRMREVGSSNLPWSTFRLDESLAILRPAVPRLFSSPPLFEF